MNKHSYIIAVDSDTDELRVSRVRTKDAKEIGCKVFKTYQEATAQLTSTKVAAKKELDYQPNPIQLMKEQYGKDQSHPES